MPKTIVLLIDDDRHSAQAIRQKQPYPDRRVFQINIKDVFVNRNGLKERVSQLRVRYVVKRIGTSIFV